MASFRADVTLQLHRLSSVLGGAPAGAQPSIAKALGPKRTMLVATSEGNRDSPGLGDMMPAGWDSAAGFPAGSLVLEAEEIVGFDSRPAVAFEAWLLAMVSPGVT